MRQAKDHKKQAHELIDRLAQKQVCAVVDLLEAMLDPVSRAIANAPPDNEPESESERRGVAESKAWFERNPGKAIPHEEVLTEFGVKPEDFSHRNKAK